MSTWRDLNNLRKLELLSKAEAQDMAYPVATPVPGPLDNYPAIEAEQPAPSLPPQDYGIDSTIGRDGMRRHRIIQPGGR